MNRLNSFCHIFIVRVTLVGLLLACLAGNGLAGEKPGVFFGAKEAPPPAAADDHLGRSTPQGTVFGFMKSATRKDYEVAIQYLDTNMKGLAAQKLIDALRVILERGFQGRLPKLSGKPEGDLEENLPPGRERVGTVWTPSGGLDILLDRIQRGDSPPIWVFSTATLTKVPQAYQELGIRALDAYVPKFLVDSWLLWFPLWRWVLIILIFPILFLLAVLLSRLMISLLLFFSRRKFQTLGDRPVLKLTGPIRVLLFASAIWVISLISFSILTSAFLSYLAEILMVIGATWLCFCSLDIFFTLRKTHDGVVLSEARLEQKLLKILTAMVGAVFVFYMLGLNLTAIITGLGVGGIAVALAAQKTLENLFGGITVVSDKSVRMGDFCRVGDHLGTVQLVGMRCTQIRTLDRTIVSIPNGQLAQMNIENLTMRDKIWFHHTLQLRHETTADQLRYILAEIRKMLYKHSKVESASARIRLVGFGNSSLDLEIFAYVLETKYEAFTHIQEDLLLRIIDIVEAGGSGFAFPSQTTYLAQDSGMDAEKSRKAVETVRQWRERGEWPFPDFSPETITKINNQLEYPPPEAALPVKARNGQK